MQSIAIGGPQHRAAARRDDGVCTASHVVDDVLFKVAKSIFAEPSEPLADGHAKPSFEFNVAVNEPEAQLLCQLAADSGLSTAGHADERETQGQDEGLTPPRRTFTTTVDPTPLGEVKVTKTTPELTKGSVKL